VPGDGGVGGVQASGGGQQAAAALQLEKNRRSFQSNMNVLVSQGKPGCLKTHSSWVKTNILLTKANN
jgi:hypothetical protein